MKRKSIIISRLVSLAAGLGMLGFGIADNGARAVLQKAIRVCLECIGIG